MISALFINGISENIISVQGICACIVVVVSTLYLRYSRLPDLQMRAVLITGCESGFGYALAKKLDALGLFVFAACLTSDGECRLRSECSTNLRTVRLDVVNSSDVRNTLDFVRGNLSANLGLWAVVNNAGIGYPSIIEWQTVEEMKKVAEVNLWGTVAITKTFLPLLKEHRGRVVNIASSSGRIANPGAAAYCISKFGVEAFTDSLRNEVRDFGISVHVIEPGMFKTNMTDVERQVQHLERLWENFDTEIKEVYGIKYFEEGMWELSVNRQSVLCN